MSAVLLRREVMQARSTQCLGGIGIGHPQSFAWRTGIALVLLAGLLAFASLGEISRKARVPASAHRGQALNLESF